MVEDHLSHIKDSKMELSEDEKDIQKKFNFLNENETKLFQVCSSKGQAEQRIRLIGHTQSYDML